MSTSSPALRNWGSNPLIASRASRRNAMLQPGMCSATWSLTRTCVGCPGAAATQAASQPSSGVRFGPPTAAAPLRVS